MKENVIRISHYERVTQALGPGRRFVVWFQGCEKQCYKCINPEGRSLNGGFEIEIADLMNIILNTKDIQGITISGGEPFLQFSGLQELVFAIKTKTNLDIMLFSGYKYKDIQIKYEKKIMQDFFNQIDIFVDGEYIDELNDNQMFRGSSNQDIYFFTQKYQSYREQILNNKDRNIEFSLDHESNIFMIGIPPKGFYDNFIDEIKKVSEGE